MAHLRDKVAVITGGNSGIGMGVALEFANRGAKLVLNGRDEKKAAAVLEKIQETGTQGIFVPGDVRSKSDMDAVMIQAEEAFGGVDIVVPSAGGNDDAARSPEVRNLFEDINLEKVSAFVGEALAGKLNVVQSAIPFFKKRSGGSVVFVTSEGGRTPTNGQTAISAFSGGLIQASKLLSKELALHEIRVNTVCITLVRDSPSWTKVIEQEDAVSARHKAQYQKLIERAPFGIANPQDIGQFVAFLASDDAHYLTGAVISPTGGLTLH